MAPAAITRETAMAVMREAARFLDVAESEFFLADHHHENLSPGAWSIAMEGWNADTPWPYLFSMAHRPDSNEWIVEQGFTPTTIPAGVHIEALNSWAISIYPA